MKKINIIQFLPYFPPHKWGLETVAEEFSKYYVKWWYWDVLNIVFWVWQKKWIYKYKQDWYNVLIIPAFDIIPNYPFPKVRKKQFWRAINEGKKFNSNIIQTHTRFFLATFLWWIFAKIYKKRWVHIEHGSDYVKVNSWFKNKIAFLYDITLWKFVFNRADKLISISNACKNFIKKFTKKEITTLYRWLDIPEKLSKTENLHTKFPDKIIIGFIWRLYKRKNVSSLISAYYKLDKKIKEKIKIIIIWDGEDFDKLNKLDIKKEIYFTWWKSFNEALSLQKQFDIHMHTSSPGGGLATTLLQAMHFWSLIVATPNEWAKEVIKNWENWILIKNDNTKTLKLWILDAINLYNKKKEFARKNKSIIENQFKWNANIKKFYNIIKYLN